MWQATWPARGACTVATERKLGGKQTTLVSHLERPETKSDSVLNSPSQKNYRLKPFMTFISSSWTKNSLLVILA